MNGFWIHALLPGLVLAGFCGCSSKAREEEKKFLQERERMRQERATFQKELVTGRESEMAVQMVQSAPALEPQKNNKEWVQGQVDRLNGSVLFPRWEATRTSPATYEVWYTYTFIDRENTLFYRGYAWEVNMMLRVVGPPRDLKADELAALGERRNLPKPERRNPLDSLELK